MSARLFPLALVLLLLSSAAQTAHAEEIDFQTATGSGSYGQSAQGGGSGSTGAQVQTVDMGDVTGTVCDCGEIGPGDREGTGGDGTGTQGQGGPKGLPKYPLYAFAGAPAAICLFTDLCEPRIRTDPTPETPESSVPEPFTFVMLSTGLAALAGMRARRRRAGKPDSPSL